MSLTPGMEPGKEKNVAEILAKCELSLHSKNFEEAINGCRAVLNISPENQRARELMEEAQSKLEADLFTRENLKRAQEFFKIRDFQKCVNECQKIQLLDPEHLEAARLISKAQEKLEAEPFVQNFINSGRSLFESGLYNEAIAQWEKVRSIDPEYPDLERLINNASHMMGASPPVGEEMFDLSSGGNGDASAVAAPAGIGFVSDQDRIHQLLEEGDRLSNNEQYQSAIEVWSEIFMLDVSHPEALQRIEAARAALNEQKLKARDLLKEAQSAYEQGDVSRAQILFHQVKEIDPDNGEANKYLSLIERSEKEPDSLDQLIQQGQGAESRGQYREAAQFFSQALAIDTENAELADKIKNLNLLAKKSEQGKTLLGNARGFIAEGKYDSARHALGKVLESDPSNQDALELLRQIKEASGTPVSSAIPGRVAAAPSRSLPLSPPVLAGLLVLILAGAGYFFFFRGQSAEDENTPIVRPTVTKKPLAPGGGTGTPAQGAAANPETSDDKVSRLVREATFYYREKQFEDSIKMADEALSIDPANKDAISIRLQAKQGIQDEKLGEEKLLEDANQAFEYSDYAGAVKLYEKYLDTHPQETSKVQPQIIKCYYNMGVLAIREWRCDIAADYFRQVLFIDDTDHLSKQALSIARRCQKMGSDIEARKAVALMEMRQ